MKDVDQSSGQDLNPVVEAEEGDEDSMRNPDRPVSFIELTRG